MGTREGQHRNRVRRTLFAFAAGFVLSHGAARAEEAPAPGASSVSGVSFYDAAAPLPEGEILASARAQFSGTEPSAEYRRPAIAIERPRSAADDLPRWVREQSVNLNQDWSVRLTPRAAIVRRF